MSLKISIIISCWNDGSHSEIINMSSNPNLYKVPMTSYSFFILFCYYVQTWSSGVNPATCCTNARVHSETVDEQHHRSRLEVSVPIQSQDVGVVLLFLEKHIQFALFYPEALVVFYVPWQLLASMFEQIRNFLFHLTWACFFSSCSSSPLCQRM